MTRFDGVIRGAERWLERLDGDRDVALKAMAATGPSVELELWVARLTVERARVVNTLSHLYWLHGKGIPELLFDTRPRRMLKATLRARVRRSA